MQRHAGQQLPIVNEHCDGSSSPTSALAGDDLRSDPFAALHLHEMTLSLIHLHLQEKTVGWIQLQSLLHMHEKSFGFLEIHCDGSARFPAAVLPHWGSILPLGTSDSAGT